MDGAEPGSDVAALVRAAWERRRGLELDTDAVRLFDGAGDGLDRLVVERFADALRVTGGPEEARHLDAVCSALPTGAPIFWRFGAEARGGPEGDSGRRTVVEHGLRFGIELLPNRNTGLFLDARPARRWVREHSAGRRVLNLFSFTGSLGVAAAAGGAKSTVNVDPVSGVLERARENYERNGLSVDGRTFWRSDAFDAMKRARKSGAQFDGVIVDPPPVATGGKRGSRVDVSDDLPRLLQAAVGVLAPGGWVLVLCANRLVDPVPIAAEAGLGAPQSVMSSDADHVSVAGSPGLRILAFGVAG